MTARLWAAAFAVTLTLNLSNSPVSAQAAPSIAINPMTIPVNSASAITVSGAGFPPTDRIHIWYLWAERVERGIPSDPGVLGAVMSDSRGGFNATLPLPVFTMPETYYVVALAESWFGMGSRSALEQAPRKLLIVGGAERLPATGTGLSAENHSGGVWIAGLAIWLIVFIPAWRSFSRPKAEAID